jgi:hypothetical protein
VKKVANLVKVIPKIKVEVFPGRVYLDGIGCIMEELKILYDEMYKQLEATFFLGFV